MEKWILTLSPDSYQEISLMNAVHSPTVTIFNDKRAKVRYTIQYNQTMRQSLVIRIHCGKPGSKGKRAQSIA